MRTSLSRSGLLKSFNAIAQVLLVLAPAHSFAQADRNYEYDADYSIGLIHPFSQDRHTIRGYQIFGDPQILSDRLVLTPPSPGNQRVGLYTNKPNPYNEWSVDIDFRTSGGERPGGSFHFWYTAGGASGKGGLESVYTSKPFDGLALVVDSYGGSGSVRGYLNDGQTDYSIHHHVPSLAFGHCDINYRNRGVLTSLKIVQGPKTFKVEVDGNFCFETEKVKLPSSYHFGVSALTSDTPDSFELFSILVASPEQRGDASGTQQQGIGNNEQINRESSQQNTQNEAPRAHGRTPHEQDFEEYIPEFQDTTAEMYKTPEQQFQDLHDRLQGMTHHMAAIQSQIGMLYDRLDALTHRHDDMRSEMRGTRVPRNQIDNMETKINVIENLAVQIGNAITHKDYSHQFDALQRTLKEHHSNLLYSVPDTVTQALSTSGSRLGTYIAILIAFQVFIVAGYVVYKRRRAGSPKKYL
ncbi:uncharacterized protein H6S33_008951 [Morchella sextelata]|uniref:uncharacterized protein n=1 Tax=Morchella sextelata TaxID=1174677 RepID=UPI001D04601E|nr:uncharacterized protein H6S33_008951 [Morchella sextelata]KAH0612571.1 hypothetical protein H6S33_008951 [Morchella sextelata]